MGRYHTVQVPNNVMFPEQFIQFLHNNFGLSFHNADPSIEVDLSGRQISGLLKSTIIPEVDNVFFCLQFTSSTNNTYSFSAQFQDKEEVDSHLKLMMIQVIERVGGSYSMENQDYQEQIGFLCHEDGIAYFLKAAVISGNFTHRHDITGVVEEMIEFYLEHEKQYGDRHLLNSLKELKSFINSKDLENLSKK